MDVTWTITNPAGGGAVTLASLGLNNPTVNFRVAGTSTATLTANRDFDDAGGWWAYDSLVTIYRDNAPYFTGRRQESPDKADGESERRTLFLADEWQSLAEVTYREPWPVGSGSYMYPRCVLGLSAAGVRITTGQQIGEVIDYAITQDVSITKGTIAPGYLLWPSEARNQSCESIIIGEMRFHPDWVAWLDHTTVPVTFHARPKADLDAVLIDIGDEEVESHDFTEVKRTVPTGVSIIYESAVTVDGQVYRDAYPDEAGETSGRRVLRAMVDLEGMDVSYQKVRIQTRTMPTDAASMKAYFKKKWPELADVPDAAFSFANVTFTLVPDEPLPDPICNKAARIEVANAGDLPRELIAGGIEDWMKVKVGRVVVKYDLSIIGSPAPAVKAVLDNFTGTAKSFSVTATDAVTKIYKGVSSFTEGENRPEGLAAAIFAAATEQQFEGRVTTAAQEVPTGRWHGKRLTLKNGAATLFANAVIHSVSAEIEGGRQTLEFGPMGWLSAGDAMDLQRLMNSRVPKWVSTQERTSNTLGATDNGSSKGDNVGGFDHPQTTVPPGGGEQLKRQWKATKASDTTLDCTGGTLTSQAGFGATAVANVTGLSATASGFVILTVNRVTATRAVSGTPVISYTTGGLSSDYNSQIIPLAAVTVADEKITEILPLKFEELHIFEDLAVVNGEFMLADLLIASRNIYEPPPP